jgi:4-hydroxy-4-methyl-2-oxoglutarate aldolase
MEDIARLTGEKVTLPASEELMEKLHRVSIPTLGHYLETGFIDVDIKSQMPGSRIVGRAVTVRITALDSAIMHRAVAAMNEGDILVVSTGNDRRHAPVGAVVAYAVKHNKGAGIVIDGAMTDLVEVTEMGLPIFARGTSALTTKLLGLSFGQLQIPVAIGNEVVSPGDLILADDNGVVVIDPTTAVAIIDKALKSDADEPAMFRLLDEGMDLADVTMANRALRSKEVAS